MIAALRPTPGDLRHVLGLVGRVLLGIGALHLPALLVALLAREWHDASAMGVGAAIAVIVGTHLGRGTQSDRALAWSEGMVTVALSWLAAPIPVAVSLLLSGHMGSPTDAYFDAMSGLTTSGLSVLQDLEHVGAGLQLLRHLLHFAGGQGIIVVVLMLLVTGGPHVGTLLAGEGREERLAPNAVRTAKLVYLIAAAWGVVGSVVLFGVLRAAGLPPLRALLHAPALFMAAFDTGGFSVHSTSIAYYHSALVESVLLVLMVAGALSFPLHHQLWLRRLRSAGSNFDLRTFVVTTSVLTATTMLALAAHSTYDTATAVLRKGGFTLVSAATGTGFAVVSGPELATWGQLAPALVVVAMGIGAMAGSTAGGIKTVRLGLVAKSVLRDVRSALTAESAVVRATYHAGRRRLVSNEQIAGAVLVTALFLLAYLGGAMVIVANGYSLEAGLFESTSATATVGLTVGVTSPDAPQVVKLVQITQMWLGRLEFLAGITLVGWLLRLLRGTVDRAATTRSDDESGSVTSDDPVDDTRTASP